MEVSQIASQTASYERQELTSITVSRSRIPVWKTKAWIDRTYTR
jgi:hypothetical protein